MKNSVKYRGIVDVAASSWHFPFSERGARLRNYRSGERFSDQEEIREQNCRVEGDPRRRSIGNQKASFLLSGGDGEKRRSIKTG